LFLYLGGLAVGGSMPVAPNDDTDELLARADQGDMAARDQLMHRFRDRLKRMVEIRLDRRLCRRVDPSDVVQETLAAAARKWDADVRSRALPLYPWLRELALERVVKQHRRHLRTGKRQIQRERSISETSALQLAERLCDSASGPVDRLARSELRGRLRRALD